jgi:carbon-monoxide dehydrogenase large subunit
MEARTALGNYDESQLRFLHAGSGGVVRQKGELAMMHGVKPEDIRVVAYDIGGNFGTKNSIFAEFPLVLWASKRVGRPVKYVCERSEAFLSDYQGRDLVAKVELALDKRGRFLAMRGSHLSNIGGYSSSIVPLRKGVSIFSGVYRVPVAHYKAYAVLSNTMPTIPYRSAGRPEAMFIMRAAVRSGGAQDWHRSYRDQAAQSCCTRAVALPHAVWGHLRQRQLRRGDEPQHGDGRVGRVPQAPR